MIRATVDTNILVSALLFGGVPQKIIDLSLNGEIEIIVSPFILEEFESKLKSKFRYSAKDAQEARGDIEAIATIVNPKTTITVIKRKDSDNRILECAVEGHASVLITGNLQDLRPIGSFQGIEILKPREFLEKFFPTEKV